RIAVNDGPLFDLPSPVVVMHTPSFWHRTGPCAPLTLNVSGHCSWVSQGWVSPLKAVSTRTRTLNLPWSFVAADDDGINSTPAAAAITNITANRAASD